MAQPDQTITIAQPDQTIPVESAKKKSRNDDATRLDKNVVNNLRDLRKFGNDASSIKCILLYMAYVAQNNLFEANTFDPDEFCKLFGFKKANLFAKHPNPSHVSELEQTGQLSDYLEGGGKDSSNTKYRIFDTVLENCLFRLFTESITFSGESRHFKDQDGAYNVSYPLEKITFIEELSARHITSRAGRRKIVYDYKLADSFRKNLSLFFLPVNISVFAELRQPNVEDLYLFLKNLRDTLKSKKLSSTSGVGFEKLCEVAEIKIKEPKQRKQKLIAKFKLINNKAEFSVTLEWTHSPGHRWAYVPVIIFPDLIFNEEMQKSEMEERILQRQDILLHNFMSELAGIIKTNYPGRRKLSDDFHKDIIEFCRCRECVKEKEDAFIRAQVLTFAKPDAALIKRASTIVNRLTQVTSVKDILKVIMGKDI